MIAAAMNVPVRAAADLRLLRATVFSAVCVTLAAAGHVLVSGTGIPLWAVVVAWAGLLCVAGPLAGRERSLPGIALALLGGEVGLHVVFCLGQGTAAAATVAPADRYHRTVAMAEHLLCGPGAVRLTPSQATRILKQAGIDPIRATSGTHLTSGLHASSGMAGMAGMAGHGAHAMSLTSMFTLPMLVAHVAAAVITGWVLRRCERELWQAVRLPALTADQLARFALLGRLRCLLAAAVRVSALVDGLLERLRSALVGRRTEEDGARRLLSAVLWTCVVRRGPPVVAAAA
jgi:hypothetical protein